MLYCKLPFQEIYFTVIEDESNKESFVEWVSFNKDNKLQFNGKLAEISKEDILKNTITSEVLPPNTNHYKVEDVDEYTNKINQVINFIKEENLEKLVISRRKIIDYQKISLTDTFINLCSQYPNAFVYFFVTEKECWLGAFSEILGKFNKKSQEFTTMSLAGTQPVEMDWTPKELAEQHTVTNYIRQQLSLFSDEVIQSETYSHISGAIKHLRTDFKALIQPEDVEKIISELHPTPAVCGIPKDFCKNAIQHFEKFPREWYAGYSKIETEEEISYFVNLRCGKFYQNQAHLFVGGGITKDSIATKEWNETELKSQAVLQCIEFL